MIKPRFALSTILFGGILFVALYFGFRCLSKSHYYFTPTIGIDHIIDVHLQHSIKSPSSTPFLERFYDPEYVKDAAKSYKPKRYMESHFVLDFIFPFVYAFLFLSLAAYWNGTKFYTLLKWAAGSCIVFDLLENAFFAYYLFNLNSSIHYMVALCTSLKSILFLLCSIAAVLAFVGGCLTGLQKRGPPPEL